MKGRRVVLRADASLRMGTGHVMRCLTLADALRERGAECVFVSRKHAGHGLSAIERRGYQAFGLSAPGDREVDQAADLAHAAWLGVTQLEDAAQTLAQLGSARFDWLVVDHYALDARWERAVRPAANRILAIDDLADRSHATDLLLDQNLGRLERDYDAKLPPQCRRLIGPQFGLLRPAFALARQASLERRHDMRIRQVLISLGGVDADNATGRSLEALAQADLAADTRITVIMGSQAPWLHEVRKTAAKMPWPTDVRVDVDDMPAVMAQADLAIGAAGTTAWERCCMGLPSINWVLAANQRSGADALTAAGCVESLPETPDLPSDLLSALARVMRPGQLNAMQRACASVSDGLGASRVLDAMEALDEQ